MGIRTRMNAIQEGYSNFLKVAYELRSTVIFISATVTKRTLAREAAEQDFNDLNSP